MQRFRGIPTLVVVVLVMLLTLRMFYLRHPVLAGTTMGTRYSIAICGYVSRPRIVALMDRIGVELEAVNRQMSTWDPQSEISRFNAVASTEPFPVSAPFADVIRHALVLAESTDGAFDPTLQPLINLWGFGSASEADAQVPSEEAIAAARETTGWWKLAVSEDAMLRKKVPDVSLDLGAIAKGHGVDAVAQVLEEAGLKNWFVEIGGEVVVKGLNRSGVPWKIGVQYPSPDPADFERRQGIIQPKCGAVAASGDYRNYILQDGVRYAHILDPRTGYAVCSATASVTVLAPTCMEADGAATALFVMGPDVGLDWVERHPGMEALFLVRGPNGEIIEEFSSGFIEASGYIPTY